MARAAPSTSPGSNSTPVVAVDHHLREPADAWGDGGEAARGRLERGEAEALGAAGDQQHVRVRQDPLDVAAQPEAPDVVAETGGADGGKQRRQHVAVPHEPQLGVERSTDAHVDLGDALRRLHRAEVRDVHEPRARRVRRARAAARTGR